MLTHSYINLYNVYIYIDIHRFSWKSQDQTKNCCFGRSIFRNSILPWSNVQPLDFEFYYIHQHISYTLPETNSSHPKMDGCSTSYYSFLLGLPIFQGRTVSFREGRAIVPKYWTPPNGSVNMKYDQFSGPKVVPKSWPYWNVFTFCDVFRGWIPQDSWIACWMLGKSGTYSPKWWVFHGGLPWYKLEKNQQPNKSK